MSYRNLRKEYYQHDRAMLRLLIAATLALLVVTILGIAGLANFWVSKRKKSIGIRRALGARKIDIISYFVIENFCVVVAGACAGVFVAYALNAYLIKYYNESTLSPFYLLFGFILMIAAGQIASIGPAIKASKIFPSDAIRSK